MSENHWITGRVRSGKTQSLVAFAQQQAERHVLPPGKSVLLFAMNADNRSQVTQRVLLATAGTMPLRSTTPLGFFEEEVTLFWPLIVTQHDFSTVDLAHDSITSDRVSATIPVRLRPESEQYLAVQLWGQENLEALNTIERFSTERWARNLLDVIQLCAFAGVPLESAALHIQRSWPVPTIAVELWHHLGQMLCQWRDWCLARGLLTYGLASDLYWRCLLPHPTYQAQIKARYALILADDVESYPAIARHLFEACHHYGIQGFYTENPDFSVRLGLGADPSYFQELAKTLNCQIQSLPASSSVDGVLWSQVRDCLLNPDTMEQHNNVAMIEAVTRSQLLRRTAEAVIQLIQSGKAQPHEIAIIGPGLDSLARYALIDIIEARDISVVSLKEQRPLNASALVRSLLTLLAFVYQGLGRQVEQNSVAEMMVVLSDIDPVRAGLLADHCFKPHANDPSLLPLEFFPRWDRVGSQCSKAYQILREWIETQRSQVEQFQLQPADCLSQAIASFWSQRSFRYDESAILRELLETAQHFQAVGYCLQSSPHYTFDHEANYNVLQALVRVIRRGTMTANPYPIKLEQDAVILATAYQYRIARLTHRYHFWLDISSPLWHQGSLIALWGAPAFLREREETANTQLSTDRNVIHLIQDLSHRVTEQIFLCHSELSVSGQEQIGMWSTWLSPKNGPPETVSPST